jgi:hypothetical protein
MKQILILLFVVSFTGFTSCIKTVDVQHNFHDTVYLSPLKPDTFRTTATQIDTVIRYDNHIDTVIQVRHDTMILIKTTTDTLYRFYADTVYLTRILHDTVTKMVYLHDTLNNTRTIIQHDTVIRTNTVVVADTVYNYGSALGLNYPVPAKDSGFIFITFDTVPGLTINNIEIVNLQSYVPGSGTDQTLPVYSQVSNYLPVYYPNDGWMIHPVGPMICNITITYSWTVPNYPAFMFQTFDHQHSWNFQTSAKIGGSNGTVFTSKAVFNYIDLSSIFFIYIKNHN